MVCCWCLKCTFIKSSYFFDREKLNKKRAKCFLVQPLSLRADKKTILRACRELTSFPAETEGLEKRRLILELGWQNPQGLFGFSARSPYRDLWIYFDHGDTSSPLNELAIETFRCYGLGGATSIDWTEIHGPVVIFRLAPDETFVPLNFRFDPTLSPYEILETFDFFRNSPLSAAEIAKARDAYRHSRSVDPLRAKAMLDARQNNWILVADDEDVADDRQSGTIAISTVIQ
mmetsp:Transcript_23014/g.29802  ORF Transcript_23014/g.29802 Transcript_23014/m.29802 type:complete len:231 (-) Transcript_23014:85-777(-)